MIEIRSDKTAINNGISLSTKLIILNELKGEKILDYGCGKLRNSKRLLEENFDITIFDTKIQLENIKDIIPSKIKILKDKDKKFNVILNTFVLNVIPNIEDRIFILKDIENLLNVNGQVYIEVRKEDFSKNKTSKKYKDGYILKKGKYITFQKSYTLEELKKFVKKNTNLEIVYEKSTSNSCLIIAKKINKN